MRSLAILLALAGCSRVTPGGSTGGTQPGGAGANSSSDSAATSSSDSAATSSSDSAGGSSDSAGAPSGDTAARERAIQFVGARPTNVLIISIDTAARDQFGMYSGLDTTPEIDFLASRGVVLGRERVCSCWTLPGIICSVTGRRSETMGFIPHLTDDLSSIQGIDPTTPTLASVLRDAGYQTWLTTTNVFFGPDFGTSAGFDTVHLRKGGTAKDVVDDALDGLGTFDTSHPWYLHVHFLDPHSPYDPPGSYRTGLVGLPTLPWDLSTNIGEQQVEHSWSTLDDTSKAEVLAEVGILYRGEMRFVDDQVARLMQKVHEEGLDNNLLVVVWTDHGEQFFQHGDIGHARSLYGEENDGFALFWAQNIVPNAYDGVTSQVDIVPTVLDVLGMPPISGAEGVPVGLAPANREVFSVFWPRTGPPLQAATLGNNKLIYDWNGDREFYRRDIDPGEQQDVYSATDPDVVAAWDQLMPEVERIEGFISSSSPVNPGP